MELAEILERLDGVKPNGSGYTARCPAHDDSTPSLSVSEGDDGRIILKCHASCPAEDVVSAMKLQMSDLFNDDGHASALKPVTKAKSPTKPKAEPAPIDAAVIEQLHQALTQEARDYLKRERMLSDEIIDRYHLGLHKRGSEHRISIPIADAGGRYPDVRLWLSPEGRRKAESEGREASKVQHWKKGHGGSRPFPIDQLGKDELVLCEGELDAMALISCDLPAVTATCSADTWTDTLSAPFRGKAVTVLMDHDEAGEKGASKRAESLVQHGATVKVATWPKGRSDKWDVTDELLEHGSQDVRNILEEAQLYTAEESTFSTFSTSPPNAWPDPQPLPEGLPPVVDFDVELLPDAFRPWVSDIAERMQCPIDYPAVAAMVAQAAVVGRQVGIRPREHDDWLVVPNLWGGVIGRPGLMKTPAIAEPLQQLQRLEARALQRWDGEVVDHEARMLIAEEKKKLYQREIKDALKANGDPLSIARAAVEAIDPPARQRYIVNDTTVEKLGEILNENPRGILLFRDELTGFLRSLDKEGRESDRAFYLEAWNGNQRFTYDRIGRGTIDIDAACVSNLGGIQPGPLSNYLRSAAQGGADDDGLVQRFQLAVWPDASSKWTNHDRPPDLDARQRATKVFDRLDCIDPHAIGAEKIEDSIPFLRFDSAALEIFVEWRTKLEERVRGGDEPPMLEAHLSKFRSLVPTLALLSHLADNPDGGAVGEAAVLRACAWAEYLESHARRIYSPALAPATASAAALAQRLRKGDLPHTFTLPAVYQSHWSGLANKAEAKEAVEVLEDLGWLRSHVEQTGGRPKTIYEVNPLAIGDGNVA